MTALEPIERFWRKVDKTPSCWLWTGWTLDGYGQIVLSGKRQRAHRVAYELMVGSIPEDLVLDHLCRVRHCVNPRHLRVVTPAANVLAGMGPTATAAQQSHCRHGHPFDLLNTYFTRDGRRQCRLCNRRRSADFAARQR